MVLSSILVFWGIWQYLLCDKKQITTTVGAYAFI